MSKRIVYAMLAVLMLIGCSKRNEFDKHFKQQNTHVESVFGVEFSPNHTWNSTITNDVTINANSSVKKVQVLSMSRAFHEDGDEYFTIKVLNEAELNGETQLILRYDAPQNNIGLYVAFITDDNCIFRKIKDNAVSLNEEKVNKRAPIDDGIVLPENEFKLNNTIPSYANERGWNPNELLYEMSDDKYETMKMTPVAYNETLFQELKDLIMSYFPQKGENLRFVKSSGFYNEKSYPISTGYEPIIVSPFYKQDGAPNWGSEVYNSDLYYYYFKEEDLGNDPVAYIKSLPKYKAIPFKQYYNKNEDAILGKRYSYALLYWGEGTPVIGETVGTFKFPRGYKIGFMVRSKTNYQENGKGKNGEFYLDGRLNDNINTYGMFKTAKYKLDNGEPRGAWITIDGHLVMCFETGNDTDFNEILMEVEGGIEGIISIIDPDSEVYTYCFEDTENGDYDMNDVVIKAVRKNNTTVEYSIVACGARDELYVKNINSGTITDENEIHTLFGLVNEFINTEKNKAKITPIVVTKTVTQTFSLTDPNTQPYVFNKTKGIERHISRIGEDPHAIMVPNDFHYPLEKICIKDAYLNFNDWGQNPILSTDWYIKPEVGKIY